MVKKGKDTVSAVIARSSGCKSSQFLNSLHMFSLYIFGLVRVYTGIEVEADTVSLCSGTMMYRRGIGNNSWPAIFISV